MSATPPATPRRPGSAPTRPRRWRRSTWKRMRALGVHPHGALPREAADRTTSGARLGSGSRGSMACGRGSSGWPEGRAGAMADPAAPDALETPSGKGSRDENFSGRLVAPAGPAAPACRGLLRDRQDHRRHRRQPPAWRPAEKAAPAGCLRRRGRRGRAPACRSRRARRGCATASRPPGSGRATCSTSSPPSGRTRPGGATPSWDDLMGYCNLSAAPVGRYVLDLHGEDRATWGGLGPALQTRSRCSTTCRDCRDDYRALDRVYLPETLAGGGGGPASRRFVAEHSGPALRAVIDRMLDGVDALMARARLLPGAVKSRRLAMETAIIVPPRRPAGRAAARRRPAGPPGRAVPPGTSPAPGPLGRDRRPAAEALGPVSRLRRQRGGGSPGSARPARPRPPGAGYRRTRTAWSPPR